MIPLAIAIGLALISDREQAALLRGRVVIEGEVMLAADAFSRAFSCVSTSDMGIDNSDEAWIAYLRPLVEKWVGEWLDPVYFLEMLVIPEDLRHVGHGRTFAQAVEQEARAAGAVGVVIYAGPLGEYDDTPIGFWERMGYMVVLEDSHCGAVMYKWLHPALPESER